MRKQTVYGQFRTKPNRLRKNQNQTKPFTKKPEPYQTVYEKPEPNQTTFKKMQQKTSQYHNIFI